MRSFSIRITVITNKWPLCRSAVIYWWFNVKKTSEKIRNNYRTSSWSAAQLLSVAIHPSIHPSSQHSINNCTRTKLTILRKVNIKHMLTSSSRTSSIQNCRLCLREEKPKQTRKPVLFWSNSTGNPFHHSWIKTQA